MDGNAAEGSAKNYFINYDKSRDACSILWNQTNMRLVTSNPTYTLSSVMTAKTSELINLNGRMQMQG